MFNFLLVLMILGGGNTVDSMPNYYMDDYTEIYNEGLDPTTPPADCVRREAFQMLYFGITEK